MLCGAFEIEYEIGLIFKLVDIDSNIDSAVYAASYSDFFWDALSPTSATLRQSIVVSGKRTPFGVSCFRDYDVMQILCTKWDFAIPSQRDGVESV